MPFKPKPVPRHYPEVTGYYDYDGVGDFCQKLTIQSSQLTRYGTDRNTFIVHPIDDEGSGESDRMFVYEAEVQEDFDLYVDDPHDDENERFSQTDSSEVEGLDYCSSREDRSDNPDDLKGYQQEEEPINSYDLYNEY